MDTATIDICICTYQRPQLEATLKSLRCVEVPYGTTLRVLVADNDTEPSAKAIVDSLSLPFEIKYIHAPARNISLARNACLDASDADFVAWIDDDETAGHLWLERLYTTLLHEDLDAVFGPAVAVYPLDAPRHMVHDDLHSNRPVERYGEVRTGHTCNALVDMRKVATRGLRFDLAKGRTGGEDTDYFHRLWRSGAVLGICDAARVYENVAPSRLSAGWLFRRSFNAGHVFGELRRREAPLWELPLLFLIAVMKVAYCLFLALLSAGREARRTWWLRRGVMHLGVTAGLAKLSPKPQY